VGRRGGKTRAIAILAVYLATLCEAKLSPGETAVVLCISMSREQKSYALNYAYAALEDSPILSKLIRRRTAETIELTNRVTIDIRSASYRRLRGQTALAVICDEIAFWYDDQSSSNPDTEILGALRPSLLTTRGPLIAISSPHARRGALWSAYRRHYGSNGDPLILVAQGSSRDLNPSLPQAEIDVEYDKDAAWASAEYGAQFRTDVETSSRSRQLRLVSMAAFMNGRTIAGSPIPPSSILPVGLPIRSRWRSRTWRARRRFST
jgi:hypothetical protein